MNGADRPRMVHYTSAKRVLDTTSHLRGRPASRCSSNLGWKHFCQCVSKTQRWDEGSEIRVEWHETRCHEAPDWGS